LYKLYTTNGFEVLVDKDIYEKFKDKKLNTSGKSSSPYVQIYRDGRKISLHRIIMNAPPGKVVDHINHNTLDNRRENLRVCSNSENLANARKTTNRKTTSKYRGVYYEEGLNAWVSRVYKDEKRVYYGVFNTEESAANAFNYYLLKHYGEFAHLNDVPYMSKEEFERERHIKQVARYKSRFKYVNWDKQHEKWRVVVRHKNERFHLGRYINDVECAILINQFYIHNNLIELSKKDIVPKELNILTEEELATVNDELKEKYLKQIT